MLEIEYNQLYFDAERGISTNFTTIPKAVGKENMRRYKTTAIAILGTMLLISTTTQVPLGAIAAYPLEETLFYAGGIDHGLQNPNFVYWYLQDPSNPLGDLINALESVSIEQLFSLAGVGWMVGDLSSAMTSVVSLAINAGTSIEVKDATDVFIAIVTEDTPWWADWIVPLVLGEALAVAIA